MSCFSTTVHGVDCRILCTQSAMEKSVGLEILGIFGDLGKCVIDVVSRELGDQHDWYPLS